MNPASDVMKHMHTLVIDRMYEYLDVIADVAAKPDDDIVLTVARHELPRLTEAIRGALIDHRLDDEGLCEGCAPAAADGSVRQTWPCPVFSTLHGYLIDPDKVHERILVKIEEGRARRP